MSHLKTAMIIWLQRSLVFPSGKQCPKSVLKGIKGCAKINWKQEPRSWRQQENHYHPIQTRSWTWLIKGFCFMRNKSLQNKWGRQSCLNEQRLYFAAKREMCQVRADYMKAKIAAAEKINANPDPSEIPNDIEIWYPPKSLAKEMFLLLYSNLHLLLIII